MAKKYIDSEKLIAEIEKRIIEHRKSLKKDITSISEATLKGSLCTYKSIEHFIDSLQQEQPDFPTTDEEIEIFLATHPKVEVPDKYKTPDWLFKKLEQPEVDLEKASRNVYESWMGGTMNDVRRDMVELGKVLNARKEENK